MLMLKKGFLNTNFNLERNLPMFRLDALVFFRAKVRLI